MTENQYNDLLEYASKMCYAIDGAKNHVDPGDLVSESFLELADFAETPEFMQMMRKKIRYLFKGNSSSQVQEYSDGEKKIRASKCKKCNCSKDESGFYMYKDKVTGLKNQFPPYCKSCIRQYIAEYCRTQKGKDVQAKAFKKYVTNNRKKWNDYLKVRYKKERDELHDNYVKRAIRATFKKTGKVEITPEMIIEKRKEFRLKRLGHP